MRVTERAEPMYIVYSRTLGIAVGKQNAGDRQRSANVDHPPRVVACYPGQHAAQFTASGLAWTTVDRISGRVSTEGPNHMSRSFQGRRRGSKSKVKVKALQAE